jgi:hypothetical protein
LAASIAFGTPVDPFNPVTEFAACAAVFLGTFFTVGMRVFGHMIDDPYGDNLADLSVLTYVQDALDASFTMLDAPDMEAFDIMGEEEMLLQRREGNCEEAEVVFEEDQEQDQSDPAWTKSRRTAFESEDELSGSV